MNKNKIEKFIPLSVLIPSLENQPRLYHLYRKAADTGDRGAALRFRHFRTTRPPELLQNIERAFGVI